VMMTFVKGVTDKNGLLGESLALMIIGRLIPLHYLAEAETGWRTNKKEGSTSSLFFSFWLTFTLCGNLAYFSIKVSI